MRIHEIFEDQTTAEALSLGGVKSGVKNFAKGAVQAAPSVAGHVANIGASALGGFYRGLRGRPEPFRSTPHMDNMLSKFDQLVDPKARAQAIQDEINVLQQELKQIQQQSATQAQQTSTSNTVSGNNKPRFKMGPDGKPIPVSETRSPKKKSLKSRI